jgi:hypothetical protein
VDFAGLRKNLEIPDQNALRELPRTEYKFIHRKSGSPSGGKLPGRRGNPGRQESRVTGNSVAASRLGGGPQSARKPGNRRPSAMHPGEAPPTHTRRGLILMPAAATDRRLRESHWPLLPTFPTHRALFRGVLSDSTYGP